jgi:hypothetical protein
MHYVYICQAFTSILNSHRLGWHCLSERFLREMVKPTTILVEVQPQSSLTFGNGQCCTLAILSWRRQSITHRTGGWVDALEPVWMWWQQKKLTWPGNELYDHSSPQHSYTEHVSCDILADAHVFHIFVQNLAINDRIMLNNQLWFSCTVLTSQNDSIKLPAGNRHHTILPFHNETKRIYMVSKTKPQQITYVEHAVAILATHFYTCCWKQLTCPGDFLPITNIHSYTNTHMG